jgi:signal peptidase I
LVEALDAHELKCDLAADVIRRFGTLRLRVNGFSMLPSIWPGDVACVSSVDRDAYRPGDVVLYARNRRLFVHRLVEMTGEAVVTRGDALLDPDPPVRAGDLLGRVVSIERGGSRVDLPREVSWGRRVAGAVLGQSGRLVRMAANYKSNCVS